MLPSPAGRSRSSVRSTMPPRGERRRVVAAAVAPVMVLVRGLGSGRRWARACALGCVLLAGCAGFRDERHLAPLYSEHSLAGGGREVDALGGALLLRRHGVDGPVEYWGFRPLVTWRRQRPGHTLTWFLPPFGSDRRSPERWTWQLLPIARYERTRTASGAVEWNFLSLPGIYWARFEDGHTVRAWFPFGGRIEHFLSFDRLDFVLWPLFMRSERRGRVNWHFLWPIFGYSHGEGGPSWRFWPLVGHKRIEGSYDRWFFLWPFFQLHRDNLKARPEHRVTKWMVFPLFGRTTTDTFQSTTVLWPFFGYASDRESGFRAWDGPWPLVRLRRPGDALEQVRRTRVWPLYSRYEGDGLTSTYWLWPVIARREQHLSKMDKKSLYVVPLWQSWTRDDEVLGRSRYRKLWPLFQRHRGEDFDTFAFPALNPLWRTPILDEHYAWIYELVRIEERDDRRSVRGWLDLYRRERDADEDRASIPGLWARRAYSLAGEPVHEYSFLFGLLRVRAHASEGLTLLRPALPGPGWPLERVPSSLLRPASPPSPESL